jgi:glycosyltransferase involved in cell wall biosynthesis
MNLTITIDELDMGGAQHIVYTLVKHIDYSKYHVTIICTDGRVHSLLEEQMLKESDGKYSIVFLKNHSFIRAKTSFLLLNKIFNKIKQTYFDLIIICELTKELKKSKPDIIHAHQHGIWAAYWAIPNKIPVITTIHTNPDATFPRETERFIFKLSLLLHRNLIVAISRYNAEIIKPYWHLNDTTVKYINNGIEIDNFYNKPHEIFTFINVSRHDENKNQSLILKAFAKLYNENTAIPMKLYLVGDGITHEALVQLTSELGISSCVEFTGYITSAEEYLSTSDVYISSAHREGLSLSVLEAMASKLPIIATDAGGVRDLAKDNGILIADNDEKALYLAMKKLRDNKNLCKTLGQESFKLVKDFSASEMTIQYCKIFDNL